MLPGPNSTGACLLRMEVALKGAAVTLGPTAVDTTNLAGEPCYTPSRNLWIDSQELARSSLGHGYSPACQKLGLCYFYRIEGGIFTTKDRNIHRVPILSLSLDGKRGILYSGYERRNTLQQRDPARTHLNGIVELGCNAAKFIYFQNIDTRR